MYLFIYVVDLIMLVHLIDEYCRLVSAIVKLSAQTDKLSLSPDSLWPGRLGTKPQNKLWTTIRSIITL